MHSRSLAFSELRHLSVGRTRNRAIPSLLTVLLRTPNTAKLAGIEIARFFSVSFDSLPTLISLLNLRPRHTSDEDWCQVTIDTGGARLCGSKKNDMESNDEY